MLLSVVTYRNCFPHFTFLSEAKLTLHTLAAPNGSKMYPSVFFLLLVFFFLQSKTFSECEGNEIHRLANFFFVGDDVDLVHFISGVCAALSKCLTLELIRPIRNCFVFRSRRSIYHF